MHLTTLPQAGEPQTMSSVEIAERTGKNHRDVMRDIRVQIGALLGEEGLRRFASSYLAGNGKQEPCFNLPKRECLILVSGYSVELRAAIIDRWQELEAAQAPRIPTHQEALRLAADYSASAVATLGVVRRVIRRLPIIPTGLRAGLLALR